MNGFILCVVHTYGIFRIFGDWFLELYLESDFIFFVKVNKPYSSQTQSMSASNSTKPSTISYGTTNSGRNSVLIFPDDYEFKGDDFDSKWLRPESKEESSLLGYIVSHLSMDSRCLF